MFIDNYEISFITTQEKNIILNIHRNAINKRCCICFCSRSLLIAAAALFDTNNLYPVKYEMWLWGMSWKISHSVLLPYLFSIHFVGLQWWYTFGKNYYIINTCWFLTKIWDNIMFNKWWFLRFNISVIIIFFCKFGMKHLKFDNCW